MTEHPKLTVSLSGPLDQGAQVRNEAMATAMAALND